MESFLLQTDALAFPASSAKFAAFLWSGEIQDHPFQGSVRLSYLDSPDDTLHEIAVNGFVSVAGDDVCVSLAQSSHEALVAVCDDLGLVAVAAEDLLCSEIHGELREEASMSCDEALEAHPALGGYQELWAVELLKEHGVKWRAGKTKKGVLAVEAMVDGERYVVRAGSAGDLEGEIGEAVAVIGNLKKTLLEKQQQGDEA